MTRCTGPVRGGPIERNGRRDASPLRPFEAKRVAARCDTQTHLVKAGPRTMLLPGTDSSTQHVAAITCEEHPGGAA
jgi:hypothetical protein